MLEEMVFIKVSEIDEDGLWIEKDSDLLAPYNTMK